MKTLKLPKLSYYLLCLLTTTLLLAMTPLIARADITDLAIDNTVLGTGPGWPYDCSTYGCFYPDGGIYAGDFGQPYNSAVINVGDSVFWGHLGSSLPHDVTANATMGDYEGHTCPNAPGGALSGTLSTHEGYYIVQFLQPGNCYYRCTLHPPGFNGDPNYTGMQGVIMVLPVSASTTTTTTSTTTTTLTTTTTTTTRPTTTTTTTNTTSTTRPTTTTTTTSTTTSTTTTTTTTASTSTTTTTVAGTLPDVGILSVTAPDGILAGQTRNVQVSIRNFSRTPQTRTLNLTLNGVPVSGSPVSVTLTRNDTVTFNVLFEKPGEATLRARLSPADINRANDTQTLIKIIAPRP
jgi:hypothetical protein